MEIISDSEGLKISAYCPSYVTVKSSRKSLSCCANLHSPNSGSTRTNEV